jgi:hypothetical protein
MDMRHIVIHREHILQIRLIRKDMDHPIEHHRKERSALRLARLSGVD